MMSGRSALDAATVGPDPGSPDSLERWALDPHRLQRGRRSGENGSFRGFERRGQVAAVSA